MQLGIDSITRRQRAVGDDLCTARRGDLCDLHCNYSLRGGFRDVYQMWALIINYRRAADFYVGNGPAGDVAADDKSLPPS